MTVEVPASMRSMTVHRTQARTLRYTGSPVTRRDQRCVCSKRSIPLVAPSFATSMSCASRKCTTTVSARESTSDADDSAETEKISNGGSALTEATDVAVSATGPSPASAVMTVTPPGCPRNRALNSSGEREAEKPCFGVSIRPPARDACGSGLLNGQLLADDLRARAERAQLPERYVPRQRRHAAVRAREELVRVDELERVTKGVGDFLRRLDRLAGHVDGPEHDFLAADELDEVHRDMGVLAFQGDDVYGGPLQERE